MCMFILFVCLFLFLFLKWSSIVDMKKLLCRPQIIYKRKKKNIVSIPDFPVSLQVHCQTNNRMSVLFSGFYLLTAQLVYRERSNCDCLNFHTHKALFCSKLLASHVIERMNVQSAYTKVQSLVQANKDTEYKYINQFMFNDKDLQDSAID